MGSVRAQVSRHESELGWWEMTSRAASSRLVRHVLGYCGYAEQTTGFVRRRELPAGEVVMIIGFGPKLETSYPHRGGRRPTVQRSFVAGLHDTHCFVESPGTQAGIQVNLTPLGARLLLDRPMHELSNRVVELDDLLGGDAELLTEQLYETADWERRFALLDRTLSQRLDAARPVSPDVAWAWGRLVRSRGRLSVGRLCEELGCSRRHMLRRFNEDVGVTPKTYARVLRFQRAVRVLGHRDGPSWVDELEPGAGRGWSNAEIALHCGYFDQAHMNRDFRQFAGLSPGELAAGLLPDGGGLAS